MKKPKYQIAFEMLQAGKDIHQIAAEMNVTLACVHDYMGRARRHEVADKEAEIEHKYMIAVKMMREGYNRKAIAEHMGVSVWNVGCYITYARKRGISVMPDMSNMMLKSMQPEIAAWLKKQTPANATVGDVILAIVTDAYLEEVGG